MGRQTKAARCKVIEEIVELIQPYNPWLLELDFGTKKRNQRCDHQRRDRPFEKYQAG